MKRMGIALAALIAALALSGIAVSSASANLPLGCYKISKFEKEKLAGNYKNAACSEKVATLTGEFALAEPTKFKTQDLWCAKLTPAEPTGSFEDEGCTKAASDSKFVEVIVLPDISVTLGGTYPVHSQGSTLPATTTELATASAGLLVGSGLTVLFLTKELTALGEFTADFTKVMKKGGSALCTSGTDAPGVILITGTFHIVLTPAGMGILYLFKEFEITCEKTETLIKGSVISTLNLPAEESGETTLLNGSLLGEKGKQKLTEYYNDNGTISKSTLESNVGAGFVLSSENVGEEVKTSILGGQMVVVTGR